MDFYGEMLRLLDLFDAERMSYAICGGVALALHGYPRFTKDIDLLVHSQDIQRSSTLVGKLGFGFPTGPIPFDVGTERERVVYRFTKIEGTAMLSLDLIPVTTAIEAAWESRERFVWQGREIQVVSAEGLAMMKRLAGREQDLLDLRKLGFGAAEEGS